MPSRCLRPPDLPKRPQNGSYELWDKCFHHIFRWKMGHFSLIQIFPTELSSTKGLVRLSNFYSSTSRALSCMCTCSLILSISSVVWFLRWLLARRWPNLSPLLSGVAPFFYNTSLPILSREGEAYISWGVGSGCPPCSYDVCRLLFHIGHPVNLSYIYRHNDIGPVQKPRKGWGHDGSSRQLPYSPPNSCTVTPFFPGDPHTPIDDLPRSSWTLWLGPERSLDVQPSGQCF